MMNNIGGFKTKRNKINSVYDYPFTIEHEYNFDIRLMNRYLFRYGSLHSKEYRTYAIKIRIDEKLDIDIIKRYLQKAFEDFDGITNDECMINMLKWWLMKYYPKCDWIVTIDSQKLHLGHYFLYKSQFVYRYALQKEMGKEKEFPLYCAFCGNDFLNDEKAILYFIEDDESSLRYYHYECPICGNYHQICEEDYRDFYFHVKGTDYEEDEARYAAEFATMRENSPPYIRSNLSCVY